MSSNIAIRVKNIGKCYHIYDRPQDRLKQSLYARIHKFLGMPAKSYYREFWALKEISFEIKKGETVGIIGRNGSGKSTLLQLVCGTLAPTCGGIRTRGRIAALLELGSGFNPEFTGRENVNMNASILGLTKNEINSRFDDIAAFADIGDFIEQPVKTYSSGMLVRLAFAVSVCVEPDILVVDEALSVGDMAFQQKCLNRLSDLRESGTTILLVTHDIMLTRNYCSRVIYLDHGVIREIGDAETVGEAYIKDIYEEQHGRGSTSNIIWKESTGKLSFGTSGGKITSVQLTSSNPAGNIVKEGDLITVRLTARVSANVHHPEFIVQIRDIRGYIIYGLSSGSDSIQFEQTGKETILTSAFDFTVIFSPGEYAISIGLIDRHGDKLNTVLEKIVAAVTFSVVSSATDRFHGVVNLKGHWHK